MFNKSTVDKAIQYTESLRSSGKAVRPNSDLLSDVVASHIYPYINTLGISLESHNVEQVHEILTTNSSGASDESDMIDSKALEVANTLQANIEIATKVAIPIINNAIDNLNISIDKLNDELRKEFSIDIVPNKTLTLASQNSTIVRLLEGASDTTFTEYAHGIKLFPPKDYEGIVELMRTGSHEFDTAVSELLATVTPEQVEYIYQFRMASSYPRAVMRDLRNDEKFIMWLIGYALTSATNSENIPDDVDIPLDKFRQKVIEYRSVCLHGMNKLIKDFQFKENSGCLVYDSYTNNEGTRVLEVIPSVQQKATEAGISVDVLIGSTLVNDGVWYLTSLIRDKEKYIKAFTQANENSIRKMASQKANLVSSATINAINTVMQQHEQGIALSVGTFKMIDVNYHELEQFIKQAVVSSNGTREFTEIISTVLMDRLFHGTMVPSLLRKINTLSVDYPTARVEELAAKASVDIIIKHLMTHIDVVSV